MKHFCHFCHWGQRNVTLCFSASGVPSPSHPPTSQHRSRRLVGLHKMFLRLEYSSFVKFYAWEVFFRPPQDISESSPYLKPSLDQSWIHSFKDILIFLRSIYCSPVHGLMSGQVSENLVLKNAFEASWKYIFYVHSQ